LRLFCFYRIKDRDQHEEDRLKLDFRTALRDALKARLVKKTTKEWNPNGKEPELRFGIPAQC